MLRIRVLLFVFFGFVAVVPLILFGAWSYSQVLTSEFDQVRDRHLLLARNLGQALERYHRDVSATFNVIAGDLARQGTAQYTEELLRNFDFRHICLVDPVTGKVLAQASLANEKCPEVVPRSQLEALLPLANADSPTFSPVAQGPDGAPAIYVVRLCEGMLVIGDLKTDYFVNLGKEISFGVNGHAAIVDQRGSVLAHPLDSWVAERRNIAQVSAVQRMLAGETGIEQFYSPALEADMIAGFTSVPGPGWGVMIPQPVSELYGRAANSQKSTLLLLVACVVVIAFLSAALAMRFARPLELVTEAARRSRETGTPIEAPVSSGWLVPREIREVQSGFNSMASRLRETLDHIRRLAFVDTITDLPNREYFGSLIEEELRRLGETGGSALLLHVDLDDFKTVNETMGPDIGDKVLRHVSLRLGNSVRIATGRQPIPWPFDKETGAERSAGSPVIGRIAGDEFAVFLPNLERAPPVEDIVAAVSACFAAPIQIDDEIAALTASVGAVVFPNDGDTFAILDRRADIALNHAQRTGKNRSQIYKAQIGDETISEIRRNVRLGLNRGEFVLHYQPKVRSDLSRIDGIEALVRWNHPERGQLAPGAFLPMIENSDVIVELGKWVVGAAAVDLSRLDSLGLNVGVAINISSRQFCAPGFVDLIESTIRESGIDPSKLEIEVTEEALLSNVAVARRTIHSLRAMGARIALDDFGRGYSNLSRVAGLDVDTIKIDGQLTQRITNEKRVAVVVKSTIEMALGLGCATVVEGVETAEQAERVTRFGCTHIQGYLIARPMEFDDLVRWIKTYDAEDTKSALKYVA